MTQRDVTLHCLLHTAQAGASADFRQGIVSRAPESSSHQRRIPGVCDLGVNPKRRSIKHDKIDRRLVFRSLWVLGRLVDPTAYACATKIVFRYSTSVVTAAGVESGSPGAKTSKKHSIPTKCPVQQSMVRTGLAFGGWLRRKLGQPLRTTMVAPGAV